jgi:type IV fimbrial biogenesis protein FimT
MMRPMKTRSRGVTLLELMIGITVLGILMAIAVPGFTNFTLQTRVTAASNDLVTALNLARSEALRASAPAVACASSDGATCSDSTEWSQGWIVFADADGDGDVDDRELRQVWPATHPRLTLATAVSRVTYNAMGMITTPGTFDIATAGCAVEREVVTTVSLSGSIRSSRTTCEGGGS